MCLDICKKSVDQLELDGVPILFYGGGMAKGQTFFEEQTDQSEVKARIIQKYFYAWANIIMPSAEKADGKIGYIDLYAGPGRYKDGAASTPLLVLEHAVQHPKMSQMLVALFNDMDGNNTKTLKSEIDAIDGIDNLKYYPSVQCNEVDEDATKFFTDTQLIPSFSFIDPFGYKGLSLDIVHGVIKDWGCDCVFFFNYGRINAGITNKFVEKHIDALFGKERADFLRDSLPGLSPEKREEQILEAITEAIQELGGKYVLPFRFKRGKRTSHSLIFVSKHFLGYHVMKEIMAAESSLEEESVATFVYSEADETMPLLFALNQPLTELRGMLLEQYGGQKLSVLDLYEDHSVGRRYIKRNYKEVLALMEQDGLIKVKSAKARRKNTFADHLVVEFPEK